MIRRIGLVAMLSTTIIAGAHGQSSLLPRMLSAPFPEDLVAAAGKSVVAWVTNAQGVRNVWVAAAPDYKGRQLTSYAADDGQEISDLALSPDGATLFYVRGGGANRRGEIPNPTSDPGGQEQNLWRVSVAGGAPVKVAAGTSPEVSPKGDVVVFSSKGQIWSAPLAGAAAPQALIKVRGGASDLSWSPDGGMIAFSSRRTDHGFVGVYDVASRAIRWLDPTYDLDNRPVWSPDGKQIAFIRIPAGFDPPLFGPMRESSPWSIRVANAATGATRQVWIADRGQGSVLHGIVGRNLMWSADDRLVFPWEKDGWAHLYSISASGGGAPVALTPGDGEVEYVALSPDRRSVLYNTNIGDTDRRHLFRVSVSGGTPSAVTQGSGIEWSPTQLADGAIAYLRSNAKTPAHAAILVGGQARPLASQSMPADFPADQLVEPQAVIVTATDGMQIHAQLFLPKDLRPGEKRAALAFFHGGSRRQMLLGFHYMYYYHNAYAFNQYLASQGYVVLSVNYRSGIGYGMQFREALQYGATGASEFNDVMGAGLYLKSRPDVDPAKVGIWGGSYGGYLTAMGLAKASNLFAAGVDFHGVHDWNLGIQTFRPDYNPLEKPEFARLAFESSPMAWVDGWRSPVLLIHGDDDRNVDFHQTVMLLQALRKRGVEPEQLVFPDEVHDLLTHASWSKAYAATVDFFNRKLRESP